MKNKSLGKESCVHYSTSITNTLLLKEQCHEMDIEGQKIPICTYKRTDDPKNPLPL